MNSNWLEIFRDSNEKFIYELIALEVYDELTQKIAVDESLATPDSKREKLYMGLEKKYDGTKDPFIKLVIAHSFVTGEYQIMTDWKKFGTLGMYKGENRIRYNEFESQIYNSAVYIVDYLVENEIQFQLACNILQLAVQASRKTKSELKIKIMSWVNSIELNSNEELTVSKVEFLIPVIHYLLEDREYRKPELLSKIDFMLDFSITQGDTAKSERAKYNEMGFYCIFPDVFQLKVTYFQKLNDTLNEKEVIKKFAETHEKVGGNRAEKGDVFNIEGAIIHYEKAVNLYRNYGLNIGLNRSKIRLDNLKRKMAELPNPNSIIRQRNLLSELTREDHKTMQKTLDDFNLLPTQSQVIELISNLPVITKDQIALIRNRNKLLNQFSELFITEIKNEYDQTIFRTSDDKTKESYALYKHIQKSMILSFKMLEIIKKQNKIIDSSIFVNGVKSISRRKYFFIKAFDLFFVGDIYSALYILTPQVEWWFREASYYAGAQTSNFKKFPTEEAKTLIPLFELNELKEILGEEQHWLFKQLMTKEPMNIRNKVAHGLELNDNGHCIYFVLCVLRLIIEETFDYER